MQLQQVDVIGVKILETLIDALRDETRIPFVKSQRRERIGDVPAFGEEMELAAPMPDRFAD